jgi:hypothetical protein
MVRQDRRWTTSANGNVDITYNKGNVYLSGDLDVVGGVSFERQERL